MSTVNKRKLPPSNDEPNQPPYTCENFPPFLCTGDSSNDASAIAMLYTSNSNEDHESGGHTRFLEEERSLT